MAQGESVKAKIIEMDPERRRLSLSLKRVDEGETARGEGAPELGLSEEVLLVNRSDYYDERYPFGTRVPAIATSAFTIVGTGSGPGL